MGSRKNNFNNFGVPWYAPSETPAIRGGATGSGPDMGEGSLDRDRTPEEAKRFDAACKKTHEKVKLVRDNWSEGDHLVLKESYSFRYGLFKEIRKCGLYWKVFVEFTDGMTRPNGKPHNPPIGLSAFIQLAQKVDNSGGRLESIKTGDQTIRPP
jgi:hypothetical protein